jgi:hypothetical protein
MRLSRLVAVLVGRGRASVGVTNDFRLRRTVAPHDRVASPLVMCVLDETAWRYRMLHNPTL